MDEMAIMQNGLKRLRKNIFQVGECNMRKKIIVLVSIFTLLLSLTACYIKYKKTLRSDLIICASYAVPGMYCNDLKELGVLYEVMETDSYGRILFQFSAKNCITEKVETVYVICQKNVSKYVYFYEDICYQFAQGDNDDLTELKERNDWECELNKEKMSRRESMESLGGFIIEDCDLKHDEVVDAGKKEFVVTNEECHFVSFLDADSEGKGMYLLSVEDGEDVKKYVAIVSTEYEVSYMEAPDEIDSEVFAEFKKENGWKYGW